MKSKTVLLVLGAAAAVGAVIYFRNKNEEAKKAPAVMAPSGEFTATKSPVQINPLPGTLLQPTSGNTGIVPPAIQAEISKPLEIATAVQKTDFQRTIDFLKSRKNSLTGADAYLFT